MAKLISRIDMERKKYTDTFIVREALKRKLPTFMMQGRRSEYSVGIGAKAKRIGHNINLDLSAKQALNKFSTYEILKGCGISIPGYTLLEKKDRRNYRKAIKGLKFPLVVKPSNWSLSIGVTLGIKNHKQLKAAFVYGFKYSDELMIEEFVGNAMDYRLTFFRGEFLGSVVSIPQFIKGDGKRSIKDLVKELNRKRKKKYGATARTDDWITNTYLAQHNYKLGSVLPRGKAIQIYSGAGLYENVSNEVHPENIEMARNACEVLGLEMGGVDLISPDASVPFHKNGAIINEVNSAPDISIYEKVFDSKKQDLAKKIVRIMFPTDKSAWIPIKHRGRTITDVKDLRKLLRKKPKLVRLNNPDRTIKNAAFPLISYLLNNNIRGITI